MAVKFEAEGKVLPNVSSQIPSPDPISMIDRGSMTVDKISAVILDDSEALLVTEV